MPNEKNTEEKNAKKQLPDSLGHLDNDALLKANMESRYQLAFSCMSFFGRSIRGLLYGKPLEEAISALKNNKNNTDYFGSVLCITGKELDKREAQEIENKNEDSLLFRFLRGL